MKEYDMYADRRNISEIFVKAGNHTKSCEKCGDNVECPELRRIVEELDDKVVTIDIYYLKSE